MARPKPEAFEKVKTVAENRRARYDYAIDDTFEAGIVLTGHKMDQKFYFSHSGYAGGAKTTPIKRVMERDPRKVVYLAVKRMIRNNRLRGKQLARLKIYTGDKHPHPVAPKSA